jgi:YidC/Oxa1 family membrane protein insertase
MEKRLMLAIALSIATIFGYQFFFEPPAPRKGAPPAAIDNGGKVADNGSVASPAPAGAPAAAAAPVTAAASSPSAPARAIVVETPLLSATIDTEGGGLTSLRLPAYREKQGAAGPGLDILGAGGYRPRPLELSFEGSDPAFPALIGYGSDAPSRVTLAPGEKRSVLLSWQSPAGLRVTREFLFDAGRYDFEVKSSVTNGSAAPVKVARGVSLSQDYRGELAGDSYTFKGLAASQGGKVNRYSFKDIGKGKIEKEPVKWAAADQKYFTLAVLPEKEWALKSASLIGDTGARAVIGEAEGSVLRPGEGAVSTLKVYAGPKEGDHLAKAWPDLPSLVDYGWFSFLARPLFWLLKASHRATGNFGLDIIVLTLLVKGALFPLSHKSMSSMKKIQELQPVMAKLKEKYKGDPQRMNQEVMNLYKTYKVNPLGGCLPLLVQIPFFIALYKVLLLSVELRHAPFALWIRDLSVPDQLFAITAGGFHLPVRLLPLLMGGTMFLQQSMTPAGGMDPTQQKMMLYIMPVVFLFMFWGFPAGLVLYWLLNNVLSIAQQAWYNRAFAREKAARDMVIEQERQDKKGR